jgi:hypothetical protein
MAQPVIVIEEPTVFGLVAFGVVLGLSCLALAFSLSLLSGSRKRSFISSLLLLLNLVFVCWVYGYHFSEVKEVRAALLRVQTTGCATVPTSTSVFYAVTSQIGGAAFTKQVLAQVSLAEASC